MLLVDRLPRPGPHDPPARADSEPPDAVVSIPFAHAGAAAEPCRTRASAATSRAQRPPSHVRHHKKLYLQNTGQRLFRLQEAGHRANERFHVFHTSLEIALLLCIQFQFNNAFHATGTQDYRNAYVISTH